jgi:methylase of polypeptide subunit release factors
LFPDKRRVLHLFAGKVDLSQLPGDTVDIRPELEPSYCVNAETLEGVPLDRYDMIVADPPYSAEDAEHYGVAMVNRDKVMRTLEGVACGCHVVWLDQVLPRYRKASFVREAVIGVSRSTGHRFRVVNIFRRV